MRAIRNLAGTLLIAGMAAYAWSPRAAAEPVSSTAFAAQQEQTAPPKQKETPPKQKETKPETKSDKPAKAEHQQPQAQQQEKADHPQQQREAREQPEQAQKGRNQPGGAHGRISDTNYRAHFGQGHSFAVRRVVTTTRIVPNQTQFVYGGYTFIFLDPWPPEWAMTDDCYIDYEDGEYVLIDLAHPGVTIALEIGG